MVGCHCEPLSFLLASLNNDHSTSLLSVCGCAPVFPFLVSPFCLYSHGMYIVPVPLFLNNNPVVIILGSNSLTCTQPAFHSTHLSSSAFYVSPKKKKITFTSPYHTRQQLTIEITASAGLIRNDLISLLVRLVLSIPGVNITSKAQNRGLLDQVATTQ